MKKSILAAALLAVMATGCDKEAVQPTNRQQAISFRTQVNGSSNVRASGAAWDAADEIGVYMIPAAENNLDNMIHGNKKHVTDDPSGNFAAAAGHELYFPLEGNVDFIAYYPYNGAVGTDHIVPVSVAVQDEPAAIDLMYAKTSAGYNAQSSQPTLAFSHKLAQLVFEVVDTKGASIEGVTAKITGLHTAGGFDLSTGVITPTDGSQTTAINLRKISESGAAARFEAIVLPSAAAAFTIEISVPGSKTMTKNVTSKEIVEGKTYITDVNMAAEDVGSMIEMGTAGIGDWVTDATRDNLDMIREQADPSANWTSVFSDDFSHFTNSSTTAWSGNSDWTTNGSTTPVYPNTGMAKFGSGSKPGSLTSKSLDFDGATTVKVTVTVKGWSSVEGTLNVTVGSTTKNIVYTEVDIDTPGTYSVEFTVPGGTGTVTLATSAKRAYVDEVIIEKK